MSVFWIVLLIILLAGLFLKFVPLKVKTSNSEKYGYGWPYELPSLNYFESAETPVLSFWYDPVVSSDEGSQTTWGMSKDLPENDSTNLDEVFGPDSYVRYNIEDIDMSQPE